jgi:hypothetical protein
MWLAIMLGVVLNLMVAIAIDKVWNGLGSDLRKRNHQEADPFSQRLLPPFLISNLQEVVATS